MFLWITKSTGTLVCDYLLPGKNLYLFSTGTGLAPFMSIVRDPETYERFEKVILYSDWNIFNSIVPILFF